MSYSKCTRSCLREHTVSACISLYCKSGVHQGPAKEELNKQYTCATRFPDHSGAKSFVPPSCGVLAPAKPENMLIIFSNDVINLVGRLASSCRGCVGCRDSSTLTSPLIQLAISLSEMCGALALRASFQELEEEGCREVCCSVCCSVFR